MCERGKWSAADVRVNQKGAVGGAACRMEMGSRWKHDGREWRVLVGGEDEVHEKGGLANWERGA
jgi:hypothetical protein